MKKFLIAASAVCLVGLGAFAKEKLFSQTTAFYENASGSCISITLGAANLQAQQTGNPQAFIKASDNSSYLVYLDNTGAGGTCQHPAELIP